MNAVPKPRLPDLPFKNATCSVCGRSFSYLSVRPPRICKDGECRYKYRYRIDTNSWANHQPDLFEKKPEV